ncbi:MAG TPA: hypothetical protein DIT28_06235 [Oxalobacteraceae bacterium]|nr:hypothetical protein [Oxalobacteraceae bacterium]
MRIPIILIVSIILLSGCATPSEQAAQMQREMDRTVVIYGPACEKLGYTVNTDQWRSCVLQLSAKDDVKGYGYYPYPYYGPYYPHWGY